MVEKLSAAPWLAVVACIPAASCTNKPGMGVGTGLDGPYVQTPAPVVRGARWSSTWGAGMAGSRSQR